MRRRSTLSSLGNVMDTDRNLLFGVLALQAGLITSGQFVEACALWAMRKSFPLSDLLIERGWLVAADQDHLNYLLERRVYKYGGNVHASLAAIPDDIEGSLAALADDDIQRSLASEPLLPDCPSSATIDYVPTQSERYCRRRLHATGGIGRVWLAHDRDLGREVALKELRPEHTEQTTLGARFLQEARITGQLEHPGIIPVYELVHSPNGLQPYYTMRFVKGRTLSAAARAHHEKRLAGQENGIEIPVLLSAFVTVCNTVAYAHSRGVIHRDLKGQNIILGDFGEVVVLDWGLAKLVGQPDGEVPGPSVLGDLAGIDSGYTLPGEAMGTPAYMAPEQSAGRVDQIDRRTDVYGLGAVLYEILAGVPPFSGASTDEVLRKVREEAPAPPRQHWPEVPPALEAMCLRALAKRPEDRPAAAGDLALEVQGWEESERRKAEDALRASEALYHSLVEFLPCVVVRKDREGRFTFANHRFCEVVGRPLDQILGTTDFDMVAPQLAEKYRRDDLHVMETRGVLEITEEVMFRDGRRYWTGLKTAVQDGSGSVTGVQLIGWDITDRTLAEEELARERHLLRCLMETTPDKIYFKDREGRYIRVNKALAEKFGASDPGEVLGKTVHDVFAAEHARQADADEAEIMRTGQPLVSRDLKETRPDGRVTWVSTTKMPLRDADGRVIGTFGISRDTPEREPVEEDLAGLRERDPIPCRRDTGAGADVSTCAVDAAAEHIYGRENQGADGERG